MNTERAQIFMKIGPSFVRQKNFFSAKQIEAKFEFKVWREDVCSA